MASDLLKKLNVAQKQAVTTLDGPVLVIAGPGTGKTTVLAYRIAYILQNTDTKPYSILALTFSESAAINMRERLAKLIGATAYQVNIFTFHGFANYLIQRFPEYFTDLVDSQILNDVEKLLIFKEILEDRSLKLRFLRGTTNKLVRIKDIASTIEFLKREGVTLERLKDVISIEEEVLKNIPKESNRSKDGLTTKYKDQYRIVNTLKELFLVYGAYEKKLKENQRLDFNDLINIVNQRLLEDREFSLAVQEMYEYILVDEYQDTNTAQNMLLFNLLSFWGKNANVFVVGDDDQAIYRFQGASVANIFDFIETFKKRTDVILRYNYRSTQLLLDASSNVRQNIKESVSAKLDYVDKQLVAKNPKVSKLSEKIRFGEFTSQTGELIFIADEIKRLHEEEKIPYEEIAILVRRNSQADEVAEILRKANIPYSKSSGSNIMQNTFVLQLITLLRFLKDPSDLALLNRILHYRFWGVSTLSMMRFLNIANDFIKEIREKYIKLKEEATQLTLEGLKKDSIPSTLPFDELLILLDKSDIPQQDKKKLAGVIHRLIKWHNLSKTLNVLRLVELVLDESKMIDYILTLDTKFEDLASVNSFIGQIKGLVQIKPTLLLEEFLEILELIEKFNIVINSEDVLTPREGVQVLTVHSAKGLEFEVVFIPQFTHRYWKPSLFNRKVIPDLFYFTRRIDLSKKDVKDNIVQARLDQINNPKPYKEKLYQLVEDDQRRLFYVALTRAKRRVYLTYSKYSVTGVNKLSEEVVSAFFYDIPSEFIEELDVSKYLQIRDDDKIKLLFKASDLSEFYISTADEKQYLERALDRFNLSPSALVAYLKDPYEFYLNYFLKVPRPTSISQAYGKAVHKAIQRYYEYLKRENTPLTYEQLRDIFVNTLKKEYLTEAEINDLLERADFELKTYYEQRLAKIEKPPLFVEISATVGFAGFPLKGIIDRVEILDEDKGWVRIVDVKTSHTRSKNDLLGVTKNAEKLGDFGSEYLIQLYFYRLIFELDYRLNRGRYKPVSGAIDFTRPTNKINPVLGDIVELEFDDIKYEEFKQLLVKVAQDIFSLRFLEER